MCGVHKRGSGGGPLTRLLDCGAMNISKSGYTTHQSPSLLRQVNAAKKDGRSDCGGLGGGGADGGGPGSRRHRYDTGAGGGDTSVYGDLSEVLKHLRTITDRLRDSEEQESIRAQWKMLARMLDRIFLLVFILIIVLSTFSLLVLYPLLGRSDNI